MGEKIQKYYDKAVSKVVVHYEDGTEEEKRSAFVGTLVDGDGSYLEFHNVPSRQFEELILQLAEHVKQNRAAKKLVLELDEMIH